MSLARRVDLSPVAREGLLRRRRFFVQFFQLNEDFDRFKLLHAKIMALATDEDLKAHEYFTKDYFGLCEAAYLTASDHMSEWKARLEPPESISLDVTNVGNNSMYSLNTRSNIHLPRIHLPTFNGNFSDWEAFRDQFRSLIINNDDLLNVSRLQYLHLCLRRDALNLIKNISLTDANFKTAWDILVSRYDNTRRLVHEHIHTLHSLPPITSESAGALISLRDKTAIAIQSLKNLGRPVDTWDDILNYLITQKLGKVSRKAWELRHGDNTDNPTYEQLDQFLTSRIRALENIYPVIPAVKNSKSSSVSSHNTTTTQSSCSLCRRSHILSACSDFRNKSPSE